MKWTDIYNILLIVSVLASGSACWYVAVSVSHIASSYNTIQQIQEDIKHLQDITSVLEPAREGKRDGF